MSDYVASIGLSTDDFQKSAKQVIAYEKAIESQSDKTAKSVSKIGEASKGAGKGMELLGKFAGIFGISLSIGAAVAGAKRIIDYGDASKQTADSIALTTERVTRFQRALADTVPADQATAVLKEVTDAQREVISGSTEMRKAFDDIGVNNFVQADTAVQQIATHFRQVVVAGGDVRGELEKIGRVVGGIDVANKLVPELTKGGDAIKAAGDKSLVASNQAIEGLQKEGATLRKVFETIRQSGAQAIGDPKRTLQQLFGIDAKDIKGAEDAYKRIKGGTTDPGKPVVSADDAETKKTLRDLDAIATAEKQLRDSEALRTVAIRDQNDLYEKQMALLDAQINLAKDKGESGKVSELRKQYTELDIQAKAFRFDIEQGNAAAERATDIMQLELSGQTHLANLAKARAQYASQIAAAERVGNTELANQLKSQQKLVEFSEQLRRYQLGATGRASEDSQDRKNRRDASAVAARENDRNSGVKEGLDKSGQSFGGLDALRNHRKGDPLQNANPGSDLDVLNLAPSQRKSLGDRSGERHSFKRSGETDKGKIPAITAGVLNVTTANIQNKP